MREESKIWRNPTFEGVELLSAHYQTFSFSKHWHDELAIGVIEDGAEGLFYRGQNIVIPKRQIVAINPAEVHTGFSGGSDGWRYRMFYFDLSALEAQFQHRDLPINPVIEAVQIDDSALFDTLLQLHLSLEQSAFEITKESLFTLALERLFTQHGSSKKTNDNAFCAKAGYLARDFLRDNFRENPSLTELEHLTNCTKFQLIKSFKQLFGVTPHQYLLLTKVNHAKRLLSQGQSCLDTALACGFYDQSHFNRNFKKAFGITPTNFQIL
uniref:AraC family transcriptional regulator n=1 Tax=Thaumasiovibrio subtropicus TaxID=1891207 RepID=UPI00192CFF54|nr:AraC family transcriptional regulator [Thaumasiovibrio subtropicus]